MNNSFDIEKFEESSYQNGFKYWFAHEFMGKLGYQTWASFSKVVNKAMASCAQLGINIPEAFVPIMVEVDGKPLSSYKLSRFACFLVAMHADSKKPEVAKAKVALAAVAEFLLQQNNENALARLETRDDLKAGEKMLGYVAQNAGLQSEHFAIFKDAGFRGMYNMSLQDLKSYKGVGDPKTTLYDVMGLTELAGNLFRVTQTAERIKSQHVTGLNNLSITARTVGGEVRKMMIENSGVVPENLAIEENIGNVKRQLQKGHREMVKLDKPKVKKQPKLK